MKKNNPHGFFVGQVLYKPTSRRGLEGELAIVKIGRQWATLSNGYRFDIYTMGVDGGGYASPFTIWKSKDDYEKNVALNSAWSCLQKKFQYAYSAPKHMTIEKINQIILILEEQP